VGTLTAMLPLQLSSRALNSRTLLTAIQHGLIGSTMPSPADVSYLPNRVILHDFHGVLTGFPVSIGQANPIVGKKKGDQAGSRSS
jgi:hypothetical protein